MITRKRRNTAITKGRLPLGDKTNFTEPLNRHSSKQVNRKQIKLIKQTANLKKLNQSVKLSTENFEHDFAQTVNLKCADTVGSKMPNLRSTKYADNNGTTKQSEVKKVETINDTKQKQKAVNDQKDIDLDPKFSKIVTVRLDKCKELEKLVESHNKSQETIKRVHFDNKKINILTPPKFQKALRKRKIKNYAESSLSENSNVKLEESGTNECTKKIPVYLQDHANEQKKKTDDPFEFVPDSPKKKKRKGKKEIHLPPPYLKKGNYEEESSSDSDSVVYDKSMHEVLKDVREKEKRKRLIKKQVYQKDQSKNIQKVVAVSKSNNKVEHIDEESTKNANIVTKKITNKNIIDRLSKQIKFLNQKIFLTSDKNFDIKSNTNENSNDKYFGFDVDCNEDDVTTILPAIQKINSIKQLDNIRPIGEKISKKFTSFTSTPIPITRRSNKKINSKKINIISNVLLPPSKNISKISSSVDSASDLIESSINNQHNEFNNNPHKLKSTARLSSPLFSSPNSQTDGFRGFDSSVYKSFLENYVNKEKSRTSLQNFQNISSNQTHTSINLVPTPWRSDRLSVRRNPHILFLKDTSLLPSYNQEMVLDSEFIEKPIIQHTNNTQNANEIQTSILDFVNTSKISTQSTPAKKNHNRTLFDEGDFSPIKQKSTANCDEKENINGTPKKNTSGILNKKNTSPLKPKNKIDVVSRKLTNKFGIENYFGFNSPDSKKVKKTARTKVQIKVNKDQDALPMRVPAKVLKEIQDEVAEKLIDNVELEQGNDEDVQDIEINNSFEGENAPRIGLFEDPEEVKPPERMYGRKRTKRVRIASVDSEIEEEEKPKRKRKDIRTPAEEEEFNKWAAQFNAMCEEVDKHSLEIV